jgi:predicted XRE-type DNA-binding protein
MRTSFSILATSTRLAKAELAREIRKILEARGLKQVEAATVLGITQPDVSDLIRGKVARFSMDRLQRFLNALDMDISIQVGPRPTGKERAGMTVEVLRSF